MNTGVVGADGSHRTMVGSTLSLRAADMASAETVAYLDTLLSNAPAGLVFVDRDFRYLRVNERVAAAAEARDPYTAGHQQRVAELSVAIAHELGVDQIDFDGIRMAARIHDIGKLSTPSEILTKPGAPRPSEIALVREHAQAGYDIIRGIVFPWPVADMILQHRERLDGTGYPNGLHGDEILLGARIIAVADVVEAMSSHRAYRPSKGLDAALAMIDEDQGRQFDPEVVAVCVRIFRGGRFMFTLQEDDQLDRD